MSAHKCPLCHSNEARYFYKAFNREYHRCSTCYLVFVPTEYHQNHKASPENSYTHYQDQAKYLKVGENQYFSLLTNQVLKRASEGAIGLDFNGGKDSKVLNLFSTNGKLVKLYDENFHSNKTTLEDIYDFITVIHQIETYDNPREKFDLFYELLAANGVLALFCTPLEDLSTFNSWKFKNSPNHITYFHTDTFQWIAKKYQYDYEILSDGIVIFTQK